MEYLKRTGNMVTWTLCKSVETIEHSCLLHAYSVQFINLAIPPFSERLERKLKAHASYVEELLR